MGRKIVEIDYEKGGGSKCEEKMTLSRYTREHSTRSRPLKRYSEKKRTHIHAVSKAHLLLTVDLLTESSGPTIYWSSYRDLRISRLQGLDTIPFKKARRTIYRSSSYCAH